MSYGIAVAKDVLVRTRDGIGLATDLYRPAVDGELVEGERFPTILCRTPYDKTDKRYVEIAEAFVPHGYAVCLQDCRDRYRSEGTGDYFHTVTPQQGQDGYDTVEWIAEQRWSNGRVGTVGSSYAAITQVRMALERPPHLSAIWPDVVPTNSFQHQSREGGAMQLHMFWALFIHAQDAQDIADDQDKQAEVWGDLARLRELMWQFPFEAGQLALRHTPTLEQALVDYTTRGAYDDYWAQESNDFTAHYERHADIPGDVLDRLVRRLPARRQRVLRGDGGEERDAAAARHRPLEPRRHARRRELDARRRLRAGLGLGRQALLRGAARVLRPLAEGRSERLGGRGAGPALRHGRRLAADARRSASSTTAVAGARSTSGRSRGPRRRPSTCTATARSPARRRRPRPSRGASPTTPPIPCRRSAASTARSASCRRRGRRWSRRGRGSSARCCASATS